ncbi:MAG: methyltransferase domain-containing protein [Candidatus Kaelpia aquatica]|nr:methyltransferase domain-containing protein [Candidatus Kaelpia aquatica]
MTTNKWQYNEIQQIGVDYANLEEVEKYDARMQKLRDIKKEVNKLVEATAPTQSSKILEFGTGTGEFAVALSKLCQKVVAVDVSPVMLEYAQKKATSKKINNIEFHHAGFLTFNESPEQFDVIFTQLALHHLPDFWKSIALKKINSLLKKGGKFFVKDVVYPSNVEDYALFFNTLIEGIENSTGAEFTKEIVDHVKKEYSTLDWIFEDLLRKSGFSILETDTENGFIYTYLCEKRNA